LTSDATRLAMRREECVRVRDRALARVETAMLAMGYQFTINQARAIDELIDAKLALVQAQANVDIEVLQL
jgi:hypothetical protein